MPCYYLRPAMRSSLLTSNGKRKNIFIGADLAHQFRDHPDLLMLPCGQCIGCRLESSRQWAVRICNEASLYGYGFRNSFLTLTYDDDHLPQFRTLVKSDFQKFMKRLRSRFLYSFAWEKIRFFHCGEYGEKFGRPHYHAIIFNLEFPDKQEWRRAGDFPLYRSKILEELWPFGHSSIGAVTFDSAAYVARYILKKVNGDKSFEHYNQIDKTTGEITSSRIPEYVTMSRRSGIGKEWLDKYMSDVYPSDKLHINGIKMRPPKYYDNQFELLYPDEMAAIKQRRVDDAKLHAHDNTPLRLEARHQCHLAKAKLLKRSLDAEDKS